MTTHRVAPWVAVTFMLAGIALLAAGGSASPAQAGAGGRDSSQIVGGIYNASITDRTATDTENMAIAIDVRGRPILSPSAGVAFVDSAASATSPVLNANDEILVDVGGGIAVLASDIVGSSTDAQLAAAASGLRLYYVSVHESAGAAAYLVLRNGTAATDEPLIHISLAANESRSEVFVGGLKAPAGVYLDYVSGSADVTIGTEARNR